MARFGVNDAENYGSTGGAGFFSLKDDKDVATVRFLYDSIEDVEGFAVHEVEIDGKKRAVNCLKDYGQPDDVCPFCARKMPVRVKYYIPLVTIDPKTKAESIVTWERGKKYGQKLSSLCSRYPHLVSHTFEIERNGKTGDQQTTYEIYETGQDSNVTLEKYEVPNPLGTIILDKSAEDMQYFLDRGVFMDNENGGRSAGRNTNNSDQQFTRRTPANTNRGEVF